MASSSRLRGKPGALPASLEQLERWSGGWGGKVTRAAGLESQRLMKALLGILVHYTSAHMRLHEQVHSYGRIFIQIHLET